MKKLFFVSNWKDLTHVWSGTPNGLYKALLKKIELQKIEAIVSLVKINKLQKLLSIFDNFMMNLFNVKKTGHIINKQDNPNEDPFFVFSESLSKHVGKTYCYQDLSVDYLLRLRMSQAPEAHFAVNSAIPTQNIKRKRKIANKFYQECAGIFTMSKWLKADLVENTGIPATKVHHVGGGCSIDVNKIDTSCKTGNKFLFVGKAWDRKNGDLVVNAFYSICASHPELNPKLYVVGPVEKPKSITDDKNVVFLGRLTHEELVQYYNMCDYFVMPSKFEAYGLVFAEALCFGLPCIGKNICAMPEFITDGLNGYLIKEDDTEELASAMIKLLCNGHDLVQFVQQNQMHYIEQYSWDSVADRIISVLRQDGFDLQKNKQ